MGRQSRIIGILTVLLLIGVVTGVLRRWRTDNGSVNRVAKLQQEQAVLLEQWATDSVISVDTSESFFDDLSRDKCLAIPTVGKAINVGDIGPDLRAELAQAIRGLVDAYVSGKTTSVISYMEGRNEFIKASFVQAFKDELISSGADAGEFGRMKPSDVLLRYIGEEIRVHWSGFHQQSSCLQLWMATDLLEQQAIDEFGKEYFDVFPAVQKYAHCFAPKTTLAEELNAHGQLMFADVRLLVQFDEALYGQPAPYYLRFWYCSTDKMWHPLQFARAQVDNDVSSQSFHFF